jgi:NADPH-dependent curcumin reductase CurA
MVANKKVVLTEVVATGSEPSKLPEASILVKNLYLSCDPYMRDRMSQPCSYIDEFVLGEVDIHMCA